MSESDHAIQERIEAMNDPTVEFFILADHAEAVNGKLYMMGAGWDRMSVRDFGQPVGMSFAIGVLVPWHATNIRHTIEITIEDQDRKPLDFSLSAGFVTGRPPQITKGETQRTMLAVQRAPVTFKGPGVYQAVARIVGGHERRVEFRLLAAPTPRVEAS